MDGCEEPTAECDPIAGGATARRTGGTSAGGAKARRDSRARLSAAALCSVDLAYLFAAGAPGRAAMRFHGSVCLDRCSRSWAQLC